MKPIPTETATDVGSVGKWLGAAAAGALLMYLLDPERGSARRTRAVSALRSGAARTGRTVDQALHSAGESIGALTGSAADAISRGAGKLQEQAAPLLGRARHEAHDAAGRMADEADHARRQAERGAQESRARYEAERSRSRDSRNRYDVDERYYAHAGHGGGLAGWLQDLGERLGTSLGASRGPNSALLGGSLLGLLGLMRRNPAGLLVGLAGLALLMRGGGTQRYSVGSLPLPRTRQADDATPYLPSGTEQGSRTLH
jgi:hypothetical protein